jgi:hypothetical protein
LTNGPLDGAGTGAGAGADDVCVGEVVGAADVVLLGVALVDVVDTGVDGGAETGALSGVTATVQVTGPLGTEVVDTPGHDAEPATDQVHAPSASAASNRTGASNTFIFTKNPAFAMPCRRLPSSACDRTVMGVRSPENHSVLPRITCRYANVIRGTGRFGHLH